MYVKIKHFLLYRITPLSLASYLDYPRIHFYGPYRADPATSNNINCSFNPDIDVYKDDVGNIKNWNYIGTNEFSVQNTFVTGVTTSNGDTTDTVIGASILDSAHRPFAKMVDIDVDWQGIGAAVYGMMFRIVWSDGVEAMKGKWATSVISQSMWPSRKCYEGPQDTFPISAQATTTITNIEWGELRNSSVLKELKQLSPSKLQVSFTLSAYTRSEIEFAKTSFDHGLITGTIGIGSDNEPLNYGGERWLSQNGITSPPDTSSIPSTDSCYKYENFPKNFQPWMFDAPFKVNETLKVLSIDLSNSLPINLDRNLRYINPLYAGIMNIEGNCIELLGHDEIPYCGDDHSGPYCSNDWFKMTGGIADIKLTNDQIDSLKSSASLVMVLMQDTSPETKEVYPNCGVPSDKHKLKLMLAEAEYYMRPMEKYSHFLQPSVSKSVSFSFLVSQFGKPAPGVDVKLERSQEALPKDGVIPDKWTTKTDSDGIAKFTFTVVKEMHPDRQYINEKGDVVPPCLEYNSSVMTLPIDGQVYGFKFCPSEGEKEGECSSFSFNPITIRAFSDLTYPEHPTWEDDIQPIFTQYHHLYPVMQNILNLSDYKSVIEPENLGLLKLSMSLSIEDPNYMPVTRDLPEPQRQMILRWLDKPLKRKSRNNIDVQDEEADSTVEILPEIKCDTPDHVVAVSLFEVYAKPPICLSKAIPYDTQKYCKKFVNDYYFATLKIPKKPFRGNNCPENKRPLYKYRKNSKDPEIQKLCNVDNLWKQLQLGLQLELATVPLYATSLYSIADGCNTKVSNTIRGILIQEMLHMVLVSNTMIAMKKGYPLIDDPRVAPKYPSIGLPGCVHPSLHVYLRKASLKHIYEVLQVLEKPKLSCVTKMPEISHNTIGEFYNEIEQCIERLDEDKEQVFHANTPQISWPWKPSEKVGTAVQVSDTETALAAIKEIVEQGEGASPINPDVSPESDQLGHYYRLMEIVCQNKLVKVNDSYYAYTGEDIPFDSNGVWLMRDDPSKKGTTGNCYTEARAFHTTYRRLLRELQVTFNGEPDRINSAVGVMESLLVHAKRVMRVPLDPESHQTCGPVWDYEWPYTENSCNQQ